MFPWYSLLIVAFFSSVVTVFWYSAMVAGSRSDDEAFVYGMRTKRDLDKYELGDGDAIEVLGHQVTRYGEVYHLEEYDLSVSEGQACLFTRRGPVVVNA